MAYVSISPAVKVGFKNLFRHLGEAEVLKLPYREGVYPEIAADDPRVDKALWGDKLYLKELIPVEWCREIVAGTQLEFHTPEGIKTRMPVQTEHIHKVRLKLVGKTYAPPNTKTEYYPVLVYALSGEAFEDFTPLEEMLRCLHTAAFINTRWRELDKKVLAFLNSCKSLNEALKLWPELEEHTPREFLERVRAKTERAQKVSVAAEVLKTIDTDELTAAMVSARMAGVKQ
jgi:hypothetical protein